MKNGKPASIEQKGPDHYEYHAEDGSIIPINSTVNALYNNSVINNYTFNIVVPAERDSVEGIRTFLKTDKETSEVQIGKDIADAVRAFAMPKVQENKTEVLEDITTKALNPKSGNYGQRTGTWNFRIAGTKRTIKARIADEKFLARYSSGSIRFYQGDTLRARLRERQIIEGTKTRMEYEIVEVLSYTPAFTSARPAHRMRDSDQG